MKKLGMLLMAFVLVGCSSSKDVSMTAESETLKSDVTLKVKGDKVVGWTEKDVIPMSKEELDKSYGSLYAQFANSKQVPGVTFEYDHNGKEVVINIDVDFSKTEGEIVKDYYSYLENSATSLIFKSEDKGVSVIKELLESQGSYKTK